MKIENACGLMCMCVEFQDEILIRGEECETREKFNFSKKKGKTIMAAIVQVENLEFF